ncbi:aminotransferase class V-fold PLP-dependent enzyme (plasmid) [Streptomyces sp. HUAS TT11]|uniref:aminotransferase class V-fold PLP-dependent enzyme n=1 Tax=Streptomyces sp. HUAS TT11 TaxID=3447508 RepID=UPI003F65FA7E
MSAVDLPDVLAEAPGDAAADTAPALLVLKIGGSLLSDKRDSARIDHAAFDDYARQVADLVTAHPGQVVLVTGGGALCHPVGLRINASHDDPYAAVALTEPAFRMRWEWTTRLRALGVPAVPLQMTPILAPRRDGVLDARTDVVRRLLDSGALPVLSSDCALTEEGALRIVSSDEVPDSLLGIVSGPVRVVALTDVAGIHTGTGTDSPVLPWLDPDAPQAARPWFWTDAWDATGAMEGKVAALAAQARRGAECLITRGDRAAPTLRHLLAPLAEWPRDTPHTLIARRPAPPRHTTAPDRLVLLNPGPVNVHPDVRAAIASPDECHREPEARDLLARVGRKVTEICGGTDDHTTAVFTGSGTAALEAVISSVVPPDGGLLVLDNGHYGERLLRIAAVHGIAAQRLEFGWATPLDPGRVEDVLARDTALTHVAVVHHETSTGMLNPVREIGAITSRLGRRLIVDAISSLGAEELDIVADHVDWCVGTANKCLEGLPGISFVCGLRARFEELSEVPSRTYYLDLHATYRAQAISGYPQFTPALQVLHALETALDLTLAETVPTRAARYARRAARIRAGLEERGITLLLPPHQRSNSITNAHLSDGITYDELHDGLKKHGYVIYATQAASAGTFRVANMGQLTETDIEGLLTAVDAVLAAHSTFAAARP